MSSDREDGLAQGASDAQNEKTVEILDACKWRDIARLRSLAEAPGGFLDDDLRRAAWPILLGVAAPDANTDGDASGDWKQLPRHRDEEQVQLDVNRAFIYYPTNQTDAQLDLRKSELSSLITEVLRRYPFLCYFQGFHDICQVFLLVLEPRLRADVVARLSVLRIRDFMLPRLGPTTAQLKLLPDLFAKADPKLRAHIAGIEPFYALAGTLTMYAHNIEAYQDIARLFDVFLAREPVFTIYVFAQIVIDRRDEILEIDDADLLMVILSKVPPNMDLDSLVARAVILFNRYPPETLRFWRHISKASVLKTTRNIEDSLSQTMDEGREYFAQQSKELQWADVQDKIKLTLWRYRRPARFMGMAVAVGVLALYLRRHPTAINQLISFFRRR